LYPMCMHAYFAFANCRADLQYSERKVQMHFITSLPLLLVHMLVWLEGKYAGFGWSHSVVLDLGQPIEKLGQEISFVLTV